MQPSDSHAATPNRLIHETSPYLRQHAYNPVDWYPWREEALHRARAEDKPIFLSIGYSACHWCHVMEHESFEDREIAELINEHFVCVKVDREERPDLDHLYMTAVQLLTQRGGWPMSVFLTPSQQPFYGGTYWPPRASRGMPGFLEILRGVHQAWTQRRDQVEESARQLTQGVRESILPVSSDDQATLDLLQTACRKLCRSADRVQGGFGSAPKFLHTMDLRFLLRCHQRWSDPEALGIVTLTLDKMADGGIYDQLGGGFHRYSTDARWLVPHFEKMLYDNALLITTYTEAWQVTRRERYQQVVEQTIDYLLREMAHSQGAFYSTQDADSEGEEGKYFVWTLDEILEVLGEETGRLFAKCFDVTEGGNWEGQTILNRPQPMEGLARDCGRTVDELERTFADCRQKLLERRATRIAPGRDEKILVGWNGMLISALAHAARVWNREDWAQAAIQAVEFVQEHLFQDDGRLWHVHKEGVSRINAFLDDYAFLIDGLIELYLTTGEFRFLDSAAKLAEVMIHEFQDTTTGSFYFTGHRHEALISRQEDLQDNATPSGSHMAAWVLARLGSLCGRMNWQELSRKALARSAPLARDYPSAAGQFLITLDFVLAPPWELVVVESSDPQQNSEIWQFLRSEHFLPHVVWHRRPVGLSDAELPEVVAPVLQGKGVSQDGPAVYVCQAGTCGSPVTSLAELRERLAVH